MIEYVIWAFVFYWVFRFIFNFLVPVFRVTRQMKEQVRNFQGGTNGQQNYQRADNNYNKSTAKAQPGQQEKSRPGDYIDFEEVK